MVPDLLVQYQGGMRRPAAFLDIKRIPELMRIAADGDGVTIGAAVPAADIVGHPAVRASWPGLVEGASLIGSTQIQSRGALAATCVMARRPPTPVRAARERRRNHHCGPGRRATYSGRRPAGWSRQTTLAPGELLVAIRLQNPPAHSADAYQRLIPRTEMDIAVAGVAVRLTLDQAGVCTAARVAVVRWHQRRAPGRRGWRCTRRFHTGRRGSRARCVCGKRRRATHH